MLPVRVPTLPTDQPAEQAERPRLLNHPTFDDLWLGWSATQRKKFHILNDKNKKIVKVKLQVEFLKQCLEKKVIPPNFKVKQNIK